MLARVKVHPSSGRQEIRKGEVIEVWVKSEAKDGKANKEMIELLEKEFGCKARIVKGFRKRTKLVELIGI